jgi:caffeoyl-CoA O-methyltransferase
MKPTRVASHTRFAARLGVACLLLLAARGAATNRAPSGALEGLRAQPSGTATELDARVSRFLEARRGTWRDLNVPEADGRALYDIIVKNGYRRALEIGTSTGHSTIWIAWALAKTGGRVVTIEIDERRHRQALDNFREAGLLPFIDARLADAHELVPQLQGPFDFVFIDADKDWYTNYARAVLPKLVVGGCLAAHNVSAPGRWRRSMTGDYYAFVTGLSSLETTIVNGQLAVSYKRRES